MKKTVRRLLGLAAAGVLGLGSITSYAGEWKVEPSNGWYWYQNDDGSYTTNDWQLIDGKWYHFNEEGYRQTGWWAFPTVHTYTVFDETYTDVYDEWYYLNPETGEMMTDGNWEGGCLLADGTLNVDEVYIEHDGTLSYWRNTSVAPAIPGVEPYGTYAGTIAWKAQMMNEWRSKLGFFGAFGSYSMDYQLPLNWQQDCPGPLLTSTLDYICFNEWGGAEGMAWTINWKVDENNIIHISADYFEDQGY